MSEKDAEQDPSAWVLENFLPLAPMVSISLAKIKVPLAISKN
jgi:hypothetical protein